MTLNALVLADDDATARMIKNCLDVFTVLSPLNTIDIIIYVRRDVCNDNMIRINHYPQRSDAEHGRLVRYDRLTDCVFRFSFFDFTRNAVELLHAVVMMLRFILSTENDDLKTIFDAQTAFGGTKSRTAIVTINQTLYVYCYWRCDGVA